MDFELSGEQQMLRDNVARLMKDRYSFEARKGYQARPGGWSEEMWREYADMGLLGAPFAEEEGGYGGGPVETMIVMEEFGRALALEPYLQTVVLCGALIRYGANSERRAELIGKIASGEMRLSFAQAEKQSGYDLNDVALGARKDGGAFILNGEKGLVGQGDSADKLIVSARLSGARRDRDGIGLYLVDAGAPASRGAGTRRRTVSARRRLRSPTCGSSRRTSSATPKAHCRSSSRRSTKRSRRLPARRSAP